MRDFVSVHDVVQANLLAMQRSEADGLALNIGSGQPVTIRQVAETLAATLGVQTPAEITGKYRAGDIRHCFGEISLAQRRLGYSPRQQLQAAVGRAGGVAALAECGGCGGGGVEPFGGFWADGLKKVAVPGWRTCRKGPEAQRPVLNQALARAEWQSRCEMEKRLSRGRIGAGCTFWSQRIPLAACGRTRESWSRDWRTRGVRVTLVSFGGIPTRRTDGMAREAFRGDVFSHRLPPGVDARTQSRTSPIRPSYLRSIIRERNPDLLHLSQYCYGSLEVGLPKMVVAHSDVMSWSLAVRGVQPDDPWAQWYRATVEQGLAGASLLVAPSRWMLDCIENCYGKQPRAQRHLQRTIARSLQSVCEQAQLRGQRWAVVG